MWCSIGSARIRWCWSRRRRGCLLRVRRSDCCTCWKSCPFDQLERRVNSLEPLFSSSLQRRIRCVAVWMPNFQQILVGSADICLRCSGRQLEDLVCLRKVHASQSRPTSCVRCALIEEGPASSRLERLSPRPAILPSRDDVDPHRPEVRPGLLGT